MNNSGFSSLNPLAGLYIFAVIIGIFYTNSFWSVFGINILPYLSIQEILMLPLASMLTVPALIAIYSVIYFKQEKEKYSYKFPLVILFYLAALYCGYTIYRCFRFYLQESFSFQREYYALAAILLLYLASFVVYVRNLFDSSALMNFLSFAMLILAIASSMGYWNGKKIFAGAEDALFLVDIDFCEKSGVRDWVYVEKIGSVVVFMNSIEKKLCFRDGKNYELRSRLMDEGMTHDKGTFGKIQSMFK